jgi:hypothetical protein
METKPKPWWRPLALAIVAKFQAEGKMTYPMVGDIVVSMTDTDFGIEREKIRDALYGACRSRGDRKGFLLASLPARSKGNLARVFWRHMQFVLGHDVSLMGLLDNLFQATEAENDVLQDVAFVIAEIKGGNVGADRWRKAIYG